MEYQNEKLIEFEEYIKNRKVAIIGLGVSNLPLIDYFHDKKSIVTVFDSREIGEIPKEIIDKVTNYAMEMSLGKSYLNKLRGFDLILRSPSCLPTVPELEEEARMYFKKLEDGDPEVTALWKFFVDASLKEFNRIYKLLDITFDSYAGESFYSDKMPEVVELLREKNLLEESDGAQVVRFEDDHLPPCIILKSDGTTIYATRDLAAAIYRKRTYDFYKNIYVVGTPQALHFKQIFSVLDKMGYEWAKDCVHVGFGYVRFPDKVLSTRHGDVVFLEDVLRESIEKTKEVIENSPTSKNIEDLEEVAEKIGVGAILYSFLKNGREKDIVFTWKDILDFEGESGPYVQYAYARGKSILRKAVESGIDYSDADLSQVEGSEEFELVKLINSYADVVRDAALKYEPCCVTRFVTDLAQSFNKFYNTCNIMKSEPGLREARLMLTEAACICIKSALYLIGVRVVEKM